MFEIFRLKRELKRLQLKEERNYLELSVKTLGTLGKVRAYEGNVVQDEDDSGWIKHGDESGYRPSAEEQQDMLKQAYRLWRKNLHARAIVRTMVKFVIGKGANIRPKADNKKVDEVWKSFRLEGRERPPYRNRWNHREKEIFTRLFRDGEVIMRFFKGQRGENGLVRMRFVRPGRVRDPSDLKMDPNTGLYKGQMVSYGIGHDPEDVENYKTYFICKDDGTLQAEVPADEILHYKILADSDMKRGISILEVCAPMLTKYEGWLEDRITLNKVRTAIALIRKVAGPAAQVQGIRDNLQSETRDAERKKMKMLERGTVITTSPNVEYELLSPNIHAQDVAEDGRSMLLSIAAGEGLPEMILTADYSNANYSSTLVAQNPFVREIEDWQDFGRTIYEDIFAMVVQNAIDHGPLPKGTSTECEVEFQPLIHMDLKKEDEAAEIEHRNRVLSRQTWQLQRGLDPETENANFEQEEGEEVYPPGGGGGFPPGGQEPEEREFR
jgi:capsid protein